MSENVLHRTKTSSRDPRELPHGLLYHHELCGIIYAKESKVERSYFKGHYLLITIWLKHWTTENTSIDLDLIHFENFYGNNIELTRQQIMQ